MSNEAQRRAIKSYRRRLQKRGVARFIQPKNRHVLHLPSSWFLVKALADHLKNQRPRPSPYRQVFLGQTAPRQPLTPRTVSILIARRMRQASIPASGHQLRHAFASELLRLGTPFSTLQELLGHTHISSTQVYTKIDLRQLREVADNDWRRSARQSVGHFGPGQAWESGGKNRKCVSDARNCVE